MKKLLLICVGLVVAARADTAFLFVESSVRGILHQTALYETHDPTMFHSPTWLFIEPGCLKVVFPHAVVYEYGITMDHPSETFRTFIR